MMPMHTLHTQFLVDSTNHIVSADKSPIAACPPTEAPSNVPGAWRQAP